MPGSAPVPPLEAWSLVPLEVNLVDRPDAYDLLIQAACIPLALAGRDICGSAITGVLCLNPLQEHRV